ncbi:hypothetical protein H5410_038405 [Solanum commersonii]|uniref:Uncharacterized protein n=1 Tax=Solanum commersonii TaxID=4109 RepID=A0A9J5YAL4_SOLCO|nr:hypothetical protein H5410_038405 [Solanum commersonii]
MIGFTCYQRAHLLACQIVGSTSSVIQILSISETENAEAITNPELFHCRLVAFTLQISPMETQCAITHENFLDL